MKTYLAVPFKEKDTAKSLGAKWDPVEKKWYAPDGEEILVKRWAILPPISILKGENRSFGGNKLFVDLIPSSCWFTNVRSCIEPRDWDRLRTFIYERANNKCECCGASATTDNPLAAHERWHFDSKNKIQKLERIIALCAACHEATHMGLASIKGRDEEATHHLMKVTGMNALQAEKHVDNAFALWEERNKHHWELDLSLITSSGITVIKKQTPDQRAEAAERELHSIEPPSTSTLSSCSATFLALKRTSPDSGFDNKSAEETTQTKKTRR